MFVRKYKNKFRFGERYKDPLSEKWKTVTLIADKNTRHTRHDAQIILDRKIKKKLEKLTGKAEDNTITLQQLYDQFWAERKDSWRVTTQHVYKLSLDRLVAYFGEDAKVANITPTMLSNYIDDLNTAVTARKKGKTVSGVPNFKTISGIKMYRRHISMLLNYAVHKRYIKHNPMRDVVTDWPRESNDAIEKKYLENDELKAVLNYVSTHSINKKALADMLNWQYYSGMRFGEVGAILVKDVDPSTKTVSVNGTLDYTSSYKKSGYKKQFLTKTDTSFRDIALPSQAIAIFKRNARGKKKNDFLFVDDDGYPIDAGKTDSILRSCKKHLKLDKTLSTHTFRHTHVSKLAELGVPLYVIQHNVGHSDDKITREIYLHVTKKAQQELREKLDSM